MSSNLSYTKIDHLVRPQDFLQWRRRVRAVLSREDRTLVCLEESPLVASCDSYKTWVSMNAKGKFTIVLCLGDSTVTKTREIVDKDDGTAKMLWEELARIFTV